LAKRDARTKDVDSVVRDHAHVLLAFAFRSGLVDHVVGTVFGGKRGVTLPYATFIVLALRRALIGQPLSGKKFDVEKSYRDLSKTLGSADGKQHFQDLVEQHGDGKNGRGAGGSAMVEETNAGTKDKRAARDAQEAEERGSDLELQESGGGGGDDDDDDDGDNDDDDDDDD
jgi:hypothetical protein